MNIDLKKLTLTNFKGIRSLTVAFNQVTNIYGHNATGKTTVFDAFLWLLFGKDSTDRKDFQIKTVDANNEPYHRLDHEVEAVLYVDANEITLKRSLREKWTKKRGTTEAEFTGHETTFFWNDVPMKESDFQNKVNALVDEKIFKLLTNTSYFNTLKWQDRRAVLMSMAGEISETDILNSIGAGNDVAFKPLVAALMAKKTIPEYKAEISAKKKKIKDELQLIPARIDEANRNLPEDWPYNAIEKELKESKASLEEVEAQLMDVTKAKNASNEALNKKLSDIQSLKRKVQGIEFDAKNTVLNKKQQRDQAIEDLRRKIKGLANEANNYAADINREEGRKKSIQNQQTDLRLKWTTTNDEQIKIDESEFCCPTCKRSFDPDVIEGKIVEMKNNFNEEKSRKLTSITDQGKRLGEEIALIDTKIANLQADIKAHEATLSKLREQESELIKENTRLSSNEADEIWKELETNEVYTSSQAKIKELETEVNTPQGESDNSDLILRKNNLAEIIAIANRKLATKDQRDRTIERVVELERQEKEMSNELANLEGIEFSITQFEKAQMDMLESRINNRFKIVKFKLFETQINGGEVPCCITLINGVPYADANTASRAQAGLDIINVLSEHYGVVAPVFFDNRESVVDIPETKAQIINLIVTEGAKLSIDKIEWMPEYKEKKERKKLEVA